LKRYLFDKALYDIADCLPQKEMYGLSSQLRRAAVSISKETVNILYFALLRKYISEIKQKELYKEAETLIKKVKAF
jgi:hypothetical protein